MNSSWLGTRKGIKIAPPEQRQEYLDDVQRSYLAGTNARVGRR
jgi:hypothetical protein